MHRRSVLSCSATALSNLVAGCTFDNPSSAPYHLMHEVADRADDSGEVHETYRFDDLSQEAQVVVEETLEDGFFETPDQSLNSEEFRYREEATVYTVTYQKETYTLLTYTGEDCKIE